MVGISVASKTETERGTQDSEDLKTAVTKLNTLNSRTPLAHTPSPSVAH